MKNNYLLVYDDIYLLNNKIDELIKNGFSEATMSIYDLEDDNTLDNALIDLDTYSFLSSQKVIIIKNIDYLQDDKSTKHLLKYLEQSNDDNLLIMTTRKFNNTKKINKELKNKTNFIKLEVNISQEIKKLLKDYKLENGVVDMLIEYSNNNIDIIKTECDKLIQYKDTDMNISVHDVSLLAVKHLGNSNDIVFDLIKNIASKDKKRAIEKYKLLEDYQVDDISLIGLLESQLRLMMEIDLLLDKNKRKDEIAKELEQHPYRVQKTIELLRYVNRHELIKLIKNLSEMDYKIKSGLIDSKGSILMYIINI
ncbi:MAG: DNA polymerase III subunit delta [Bacilli bacterium]|nr:DNA polymerase III subunit delta [Bacilli bacterium]